MFSGEYYTTCRDARHALCAALDFEPDLPPLHQQIVTLRDRLSAARFDDASIESIYRFQYQKHFGRDPRMKSDARTQTIFSRLFALCLHEEIDPATYIAANMHGMKFWLEKNPGKSFQPNMLSGPKALNRYRVYCEIANRRLQGKEDGLDGTTELGKVRTAIAVSEEMVARTFVSAHVSGRSVSLTEAVDVANATYDLADDWFAIRATIQGRPRSRSNLACYSVSRLEEEYRLAKYLAAAAIGDTYVPNFQSRVGFLAFAWDSFASLIVEVRPKPRRRRFTGRLPHVTDGSLAWGVPT